MNRFLKSKNIILYAFTILFIFSFAQNGIARNNDKSLADKVIAAISNKYDPSNIDVTMKDDGWVILTGKADLLYDKDMIFEIAAQVNGVKRITNDINVVPETVPADKDPGILPDNIIKQNILAIIDQNDSIEEPQKINVDVVNSFVTLSGEVHYYNEKILAETVTSQVKGVNAIQNDIKVIPLKQALTDQDLEQMLISILNKDFPLVNRNNINFKVKNGSVTVWGTVSNLWIKNSMVKEFSSVEGVTDVVNNLKVNPFMQS